ncbi:helix-turn-helix transcriptional regulator [Agromyces sp. S2-1-8]|uniref:ArsR/SmtB family transcription factor n=1 Tax=unclassified Agromyces TaxID=2639701 RepID=UPI001E649B2E|nr:winged helix-turn-helix domain-containing protein [Agromyces sp. S2-1-8]MCD5347389.1 winged helix-turn-helix domain-containing protein [Agromyces sp. S2-1-8]
MDGDADLASPARLMGEPARAAMLVALLDGRALPAGELAAIARVSAPTASAHLARLVEGGLVRARALGRHRYFELAGADVADAIESLQRLAPRRPVTSYGQSATARRLAEARTCYDHLAGRIALGIADALVAEEAITPLEAGGSGMILATDGPVARRLRLEAAPAPGRRPPVRGCLDWTERRPHLAGALGAHVLEVLLSAGWVARVPGDRSLRVSDELRVAFES